MYSAINSHIFNSSILDSALVSLLRLSENKTLIIVYWMDSLRFYTTYIGHALWNKKNGIFIFRQKIDYPTS